MRVLRCSDVDAPVSNDHVSMCTSGLSVGAYVVVEYYSLVVSLMCYFHVVYVCEFATVCLFAFVCYGFSNWSVTFTSDTCNCCVG